MKRRCFLASTFAASTLAALPISRAVASSRILSTAVVITDISEDSDPTPLLSTARLLVDRGVWITCAIGLKESGDGRKLADILHPLLEIGGGIDLAIDIPALAGLSPYFQARAVYDARQRLQEALGELVLLNPPQLVLCDWMENPAEPTGVRASGFSNVLMRPEADSVVRSETWSDGVVRFFGGQSITPQNDFVFISAEVGEENSLVFYLSSNDLSKVPSGHLASWTEDFAEILVRRELSGQLSLMTVSDFQLRDDFAKRRQVAVLLELPGTTTATERELVKGFRQQLAELKIPSDIKPAGETLWIEHQSDKETLVPVTVDCARTKPSRVRASSKVGPGYLISFAEDKTQTQGVDGCGILRQPITRIDLDRFTSRIPNQPARVDDLVLIISSEQIATPIAQRRLISELRSLREDGVSQFVSISDLAAELHTDEPAAIRHRLTRAAMAKAPSDEKSAIDGAERERLLDDARHAWGYIRKHQETATGLCPATVDTRPGGHVQRTVTMWDVGSNLNAIVAAAELGLIDRNEAEAAFKRILPNIVGRSTDGRLLPQGWIRTDRRRWGIRDFDACDAGRLLSSLDNMRRRFGMSDAVEKLVNTWDLDKIVVAGEIQSVISRNLTSTFDSHCAHYAALAFRRWGLKAASPYETFNGRASGDGEMALLETIARIGPLGTEPLLLEAMEMGMSPESGYLADVLITAMEEEYTATNRLICVSETPIDHEPWFIYQGLELGSGSRSWRMDTVGHHPEYMTTAMADELMTFSIKAAFLWATCRPNAFTRKLLEFARQNGRSDVGFISGINVRTQRKLEHYTDLNTNAVILQSIAHMLRTSD